MFEPSTHSKKTARRKMNDASDGQSQISGRVSSASCRPAVICCLSKSWGSLEASALSAAEALRRRGASCTVACAPGSAVETEARTRGLPCWPVLSNEGAGGALIALKAAFKLRAWLRLHPDAAIFCIRPRDVAAARLAMIGFGDARLVAGALFSSAYAQRTRAFGRWMYGRVDAMIAHSASQKSELLQRVAVPAAKIFVLPPAIDSARFRPERRSTQMREAWNLSDGQLAIGAFAAPGKAGDSGLVQALAILARNKPRLKWKLILASDPTEPESFTVAEAWALDASSRIGADRVERLGRHASVPEFCATLDLMIAVDRQGDFDLRWFETMASGVPTVAPAAGMIVEFAKDARAALLWRAGNPWDLSRQLERALLDPHLRGRLAIEGRALARSRSDVDAFEAELFRFALDQKPMDVAATALTAAASVEADLKVNAPISPGAFTPPGHEPSP